MLLHWKPKKMQQLVDEMWEAHSEPKSTKARETIYREIVFSIDGGGVGRTLTKREDRRLARYVATRPCSPRPSALHRTSLALLIACLIYGALLSLNVLVLASLTGLPVLWRVIAGILILVIAVVFAIGGWRANRTRKPAAYSALASLSLLMFILSVRSVPEVIAGVSPVSGLGALVGICLLILIWGLAWRGLRLPSADLRFFTVMPFRTADGGWDFRSRAERHA